MFYIKVVALCIVVISMFVGTLFVVFRYDDVLEKFYRWCKRGRE